MIQSGESEPLDLGLPISNLDGLRVVLDVAEQFPGKGKKLSDCVELSYEISLDFIIDVLTSVTPSSSSTVLCNLQINRK